MEKNIMRYLHFIFLIFLFCCNETKEIDAEKPQDAKPGRIVKLDGRQVPDRLLTLNSASNADVLRASVSGNLFGRFFCDRAEFYIIKNPQNIVFSARANSIVLYYLDQQLRQTKYVLSTDIVTPLINSLGSFTIVGLDAKNRDIIRSKRIVHKTDKGWKFNTKLDNYELEWTLGEKQIKYIVNPHQFEGPYVYLEKVKDYEKEFKALERICT